jgi:hypothetical protein
MDVLARELPNTVEKRRVQLEKLVGRCLRFSSVLANDQCILIILITPGNALKPSFAVLFIANVMGRRWQPF